MDQTRMNPHRRAMPVQARSAATVEMILATARTLLAERGLPSFNTNAVARAAKVNVATLYHYFPHKNAILRELFDRDERERSAYLESRLEDLATTDDLAGVIHDVAATLHRVRGEQSAGPALRRACRAVPELMDAEEAVNAAVGERLAAALARRFPRLGPVRLGIAGRIMVEVTGALLDFAGFQPGAGEGVVAELETVLRGYMAELAAANDALAAD